MLSDRSVLKGQKSVENAKIQKFKCDILSNFQTMCRGRLDWLYGFTLVVVFCSWLEGCFWIFSGGFVGNQST